MKDERDEAFEQGLAQGRHEEKIRMKAMLLEQAFEHFKKNEDPEAILLRRMAEKIAQ